MAKTVVGRSQNKTHVAQTCAQLTEYGQTGNHGKHVQSHVAVVLSQDTEIVLTK